MNSKLTRVNIVALDKITAKTSDINLFLGETKKFGLLEIKALKCGNVESQSDQGQAAYIQVKDLSNNLNTSFGSSGIANLLADILKRSKFSSGRNNQVLLSLSLYAFIPSNID